MLHYVPTTITVTHPNGRTEQWTVPAHEMSDTIKSALESGLRVKARLG